MPLYVQVIVIFMRQQENGLKRKVETSVCVCVCVCVCERERERERENIPLNL